MVSCTIMLMEGVTMRKIFEKKQFRILLALISLFLLVNLMQETYAKYISTADASGNFTIAKWVFTVNDQDVLTDSDFSTVIVPVVEDNNYIADGVLAPTSIAYFDVTIDSSDVDVAYTENITVTRADDNTVTDLNIIGYKLNNGTLIDADDPEEVSISTDYDLGDQGENTYRFYLEWYDVAQDENMDNAEDTAQTIDGVASFTVTLNFIQKAS